MYMGSLVDTLVLYTRLVDGLMDRNTGLTYFYLKYAEMHCKCCLAQSPEITEY